MSEVLRFGVFELDPSKGELRKAGAAVRLAPQPLQVLACLVRNPGELVTREQLQREIWGAGTFVDFDRNLNVAMTQIRAALNDDADAPRFIQTLPKRGYRFLAPVERVTPRASAMRARGLAAGLALGVALVVAATFAWTWRHAPQPAGRVMLALLPFENLAGGDDALLDGLTDELITELGALHPGRLGVIARGSVLRYKNSRKPIDQVGRELGVHYVLEGTARHEDGRLRVTARLIAVADQAQIWSASYEQDIGRTLEFEQELAARIGAAITRQLFPNATPRPAALHARGQPAYEEYRQGRSLQHQGTREGLERAIAHFERALVLEPGFVEAAAALADVYITLGRAGGAPAETFPRAAATARKALAVDDGLGEAHNALANALFWYDWDWKDGETHFRRAIEINPSDAAAHHDYAWYLVAAGRSEDGLASLGRALELDPLSRRVNVDAGWLLLQAHRFSQAADQARRTLELESGMEEAIACLSRAYLYQKKYREARDELLRILPDAPLKTEVAGMEPHAGLRRLHRAWIERSTSAVNLARNHAWLGESAKALDALERAYAERSTIMPLLKTDPAFTALASEPRFRELVRKVAIPWP